MSIHQFFRFMKTNEIRILPVRKKLDHRCDDMLFGHYTLLIDEDHCYQIPATFQEYFQSRAIVTQGFENNLILHTDESFDIIVRRIKTLNITDPLARLLMRMILGTASEVMIDENGRFSIPESLQSFAGQEKEMIMVGQGDFWELWSPSNWQEQVKLFQDANLNREQFAALNISTN
jgi:MraZ protein